MPARRSASRPARRGPYLINMRCRVPRCGAVSRGPRYRFLCGAHSRKLTVAQQRKLIASTSPRYRPYER